MSDRCRITAGGLGWVRATRRRRARPEHQNLRMIVGKLRFERKVGLNAANAIWLRCVRHLRVDPRFEFREKSGASGKRVRIVSWLDGQLDALEFFQNDFITLRVHG